MRGKLLPKIGLVLIITLFFSNCFSQTVHDTVYHKRLYYLCKVWGHVKYYHTQVANGSVNWDDELISAISAVKNANTNEDYNEVIETMIGNAGEMGQGNTTPPAIPDSLNNNSDISWMENLVLSADVKLMMNTITQRFSPQNNIYVGSDNNMFSADTLYFTSDNYPSEEIRLLGLFRYWNIIHYFFPYKHIMDQKWDSTLYQFIPKILSNEDALDYHSTVKELVCYINDSHAGFSSDVWLASIGPYYPPFLVRFIDNESVIIKVMEGVTSVKVGDIVKEIDGIDMQYLRDSLRKYASGSNDAVIERTLNYTALRGDEGSFTVKVDDGNSIHTETLQRNASNFALFDESTGPSYAMVNNEKGCQVGIVDMALLEVSEIYQMFQDLWNTDAIIFDVRNYPKGTLWVLVDYLFTTSIDIANFTIPDVTYPGRFFWTLANIGSGTYNPYSGKVILLFDERTQSQAEYTCMGLEQFPDAIKVGSTTSGADGNTLMLYFPETFKQEQLS